jgi:FkbM family methyltransferase
VKTAEGWHWPDHEVHLIDWLIKAPPVKLNGRLAYQGKKQVATMLQCKKFRTAVDVGAHVGLWSFNLAKKFEHVHAFEPVAAHRECFAVNAPDANITLHPVALGAHEGEVAVDTTPGSSGDSRVSTGKGNIPLKTLDSFALEDVDLIKIDVEGMEESIVIGAGETIRRWKPVIIVEQKRDFATRFGLQPLGAVKLLQKAGYRVVQELSGDFIMVPPK